MNNDQKDATEASSPERMAMCDCVKRLDEALAPKNGRIAMALQVTEDMDMVARLCIATEKLDKSKRKPVPTVVANYCPFCGEKMVSNVEVRGDALLRRPS